MAARANPQAIVGQGGEVVVPDPPLAHLLFNTTKLSWLWLILRIFLGWQWIQSGYGKITNPGWWDGSALKGFWSGAVAIPAQGKPPISYDWYRSFIQFLLDTGSYTWFSKLIMFGELAVGIGLILGALTGIAAFGGALLNFNFIMAGSASTNGLLFVIALLIMGAWKVAGWYGLDRYLLPLLGTPWYRVPAGGAAPQRGQTTAAK